MCSLRPTSLFSSDSQILPQEPTGLGWKVFLDVPRGSHALPTCPGNEKSTTQDFLLDNAHILGLTYIDTTLEIMALRGKYFNDPIALSAATKLRGDVLKQNMPGILPNTDIILHSFFTQSAFRFGEYYGRLTLFPVLDTQTKLRSTRSVSLSGLHGVLSDWLFEYFNHEPTKYEFKIQLGIDPAHHPTEDHSIVWDEMTAPYQAIGQIEFPVQNSFDPKGEEWFGRIICDWMCGRGWRRIDRWGA